MAHKIEVSKKFEVNVSLEFGVDTPYKVTVTGPVLFGNGVLTRSMAREFAQAAIDTHFGNDEHGFYPSLSNIEADEGEPEIPEGTLVFDVYQRVSVRKPTLKEGKTRPAF